MSYQAITSMRNSPSLTQRIVACVAQEGIDNPETAVSQYMWKIIARVDWVSAWDSATETYTLDKNPDTGIRPDVITDNMILAAVQAVRAAQ